MKNKWTIIHDIVVVYAYFWTQGKMMNQIFLKFKDGELINPYKLLPLLFDNWTQDEIDNNAV